MPTWDEAKRLKYIRDHKIDFVGCETIFLMVRSQSWKMIGIGTVSYV